MFIISMSMCCDGMFCEDLLFSCCESFVDEVDYCVCGVRFLSRWCVALWRIRALENS